MSFTIWKASPFFFLLALLCLFWGASLPAAEIKIEPKVGFHGLFQLGHPFPVNVEVTNLGPPVRGILEVKVWKGGASRGVPLYPFCYKREVFLSAQSQKSIPFAVDPDSLGMPLSVSFSSPTGRWSKEIDLRDHFSPSPLILLLTENRFPPSVPIPSGPSLISLSLGDLPPDARAYGGVSAIIFYEQSLRDLSKAQMVALETWLSSGGTLLVLGGTHYALYQEPSMIPFLPVRVVGLKRLGSLASVEGHYGKRVASSNILVQDSRLVEGRVLIEERGTPILVEKIQGKGKIVYLSLDIGRPPMSRWDGLSLLLPALLTPRAEKGSRFQASWDDSVFSHFLSTPSFSATYAPTLPFFLCLFLYGGGLGIFAWLRRKKRFSQWILSVSFLSFILLVSVGGYLYFDRGGDIPDGVLFTSTILEGLENGHVEVQSNIGLFSTRRRRYDVQIETGWTDIELVHPRAWTAQDPPGVIQGEGPSTHFQFPLREWEHRLFRVRSMSRFPVLIQVRNQANRLSLQIKNFSSRKLTECWIVILREPFLLGDIRPGSSQLQDFPIPLQRPSVYGGRSQRHLRDTPFHDKTRELLFHHSIFPEELEMAHSSEGSVLFFGWVDDAPRKVWPEDPRILAIDHTLFRATIPLGKGGKL
jgi:hypothetical protein